MKTHSLIIGGTRGLGREVAQTLLEENHTISVIGRRPASESDKHLESVSYWTADICDTDGIRKVLAEIVNRQGSVHNLIFLQRHKGEDDQWEGEIETSVLATNKIIEFVVPYFGKSGNDSIVVVTSIADEFISDSQPAAYHVAKAALWQLVRYYAVKLGPQGIRVNCVAPCTFLKNENRDFYEKNGNLKQLFNRIIPLGRMGTAKDSANVIAFLCSSKSSFLTGQRIVVDGGVSLLSQEALARKLKNL